MPLLVTGATGHVGGEVVRQAAARGMAVLATFRGEPVEVPADLVPTSGLPGDASGRVTWVRCDLGDAAQVAALAIAHRIDACIHCAAISNEAYARPAPLAAITANVAATANLLEAARVHRWRRFILTSSGSVFQKRKDTASPIPEDALVEPQNIYSTTKVNAELLTRLYRTEFGISASTVRLSWVFGPPIISDQPTRGPIPSFVMRALKGVPIREDGGDFNASFTFVSDVAAGLLAAAAAPELRHDVYHLGHGVSFTARQAAEAVREAVPGAVIELGSGTEPWTRFTAIRGPLAGTRLRDDTGFVPPTSLEAAVAAYAEWMRGRV